MMDRRILSIIMERLDFYLSANNIGLDYKSKMILKIVGKQLLEPQAAAKQSKTCSKLFDYFVTTVLEVAESFRFHRVVHQGDGDTMVSYLTRLREAESKCNYGVFLDGLCAINFYLGLRMLKLSESYLK